MNAEELIAFEADIAAEFNVGHVRAPVHLAGGNEAQLIKIFEEIRGQDWIAVAWRSHYHCLLKGVPPAELKRDILAGRSITLNYPKQRIISSAIVGGVLPIALGIAWAIKRSGEDAKVFTFLGDMTWTSGMFSECSRYAHGHELPIEFIVENNSLSVCTPTWETWGHGYCHSIKEPPAPRQYWYKLHPWPHSGAGKRIEF